MPAIEDRIRGALFPEQKPTGSAQDDQPEQMDATEYEADEVETPTGDTETQTQRYKVKVNGEEREVELDDLLKGYMMESDYRRKTSEVSEQRKAIEQKQAELEQRLKEAQELIEFEAAELESDDMKQLKEYDPAAYWKKFDEVKAKAERFKARKDKQLAELEEKRRSVIESERAKLMEKIPDWLDDNKRDGELRQIGQLMTDLGFTQEEAAAITDHRVWTMARKAMMFDQLKNVSVDAKKIKQAPKTASPGTGNAQATSEQKRIQEKHGKLRKSGRVEDAASLIKSIMRL